MQDDGPLRVAVTGVGGGVGQSVLRAISLSDLPFHVIGLDMNPWSAGFYASNRGHMVPPAEDPGYSDRLLEILRQNRVRVLIPGSDPELSVLADMLGELRREGVLAVVGSSESVGCCRNKLETCRLFRDHGLPFVQTVRACEGLSLAEEVGFPLVVKPLGGSASRDVTVVFRVEQLQPYLDRDDLVIQEYLVPDNWAKDRSELTTDDVAIGRTLRQEDEISIQLLFDHEGALLGQFASRNRLLHGVPMVIDPCSEERAEGIAWEMAMLLVDRGLIGPCNLQCKLTERGPLFFEVNPRFTGITAVRAAMGFNEVDAVIRRMVLDEPIDLVRQRLSVADDLVCSRYITEMVMPRRELEAVRTHGRVEGHGKGTRL